MEDLLIHTSDVKVDVLEPHKISEYEKPCICFSLNEFIPFFGKYVYLFRKKVLEENFRIVKFPTKGICMTSVTYFNPFEKEYRYESEGLGYEFRIYQPIDILQYGLGVITIFNHMKGVLETKFQNKIIREKIDFSK